MMELKYLDSIQMLKYLPPSFKLISSVKLSSLSSPEMPEVQESLLSPS